MIFAPHGRDAAVAASLLREISLQSTICVDLAGVVRTLGEDIAFAIVTEEALRNADLRALAQWIESQPAWSDFPFIVLTQRGGGPEHNPSAARLSEILGNVSFLERPFHPITLASMARSALKGRMRQYEVRDLIETLNEREDQLRTALLAGRLGSWELGLTDMSLSASATCKALFGRDGEAPLSYDELVASIHPEDRVRMQNAVSATARTGKDYEIEYRTIWPDGSQHWVEVRARLVGSRRDGAPRLVGVARDITEHKTAEQSLRRLNESLEERVSERTRELQRAHEKALDEMRQRELAEEQLRQSQKMEMIGQLTGGVAHDFNNLLMAVLGNLELLRKHSGGDARTERLIEGATQGAQRGAALTQRLLAFARRQDLRIEAASIVDLVHGMTELIRRSLETRIELRIDLPPTLPMVLMDRNQIELALLNLVVNARDAMPDGGVLSIGADEAEARKQEGLPDGRYVRLIVGDTGVGMDEATLRKATEPFFSTKEVGKGTGLGLSMVHGLASQLNGALRITSRLGVGTVAELWLPATVSAVAATTPKDAPAVPVNTPQSRILVVDDDFLIAMSTADMLEDLGHQVVQANSATQALQMLRDDTAIDLLLTDYSMPKMTGGELAKAARALRPDLPILMATGYAELPPGFDMDLPRLSKPYDQTQLASEIAKLLKAKEN